MILESVFPTYILQDSNIELADALLPLCNKYTALTKDNLLNIDNFPSTLGSNDLNPVVMLEPLVQQTLSTIITYYAVKLADAAGMNYDQIDFKPYGFFSSMNKNAYLRRHMHHQCTFSGIIYLEVGDDVPPLVLFNPKSISVFNNEIQNTYFIEPKVGNIVIWNAWMEHEVPQKLNNNPRKSFSFNI
jgi:hypothetical protein